MTRKIAYRYRSMLFALVMSGCTALIVSGIIMSMRLPWDSHFVPIWLHAYFTAWPDKTGKIEYFADVYDRDARLKEAIAATESVRLPAT